MTTDRAVSDDAVEAATEAVKKALIREATEEGAWAEDGFEPPFSVKIDGNVSPEALARAALRAASPFLAGDGVTIKPLEWKKVADAAATDTYGTRFIANCAYGMYCVNSSARGKTWDVSRLGSPRILAQSADEAKAAAQADYEARIRSALSAPPPQPEVAGLVEELGERLQAIIDWADMATAHPKEFNSHGVRNLEGPVFDDARAALASMDGGK